MLRQGWQSLKGVMALGLILLMSLTVAQAQERVIDRVNDTRGLDEESGLLIQVPLGFLRVGDTVTVRFTRLSGDLIPIIGLLNRSGTGTSRERYAYRYRDLNLDGRLDEEVYTINEEAGAGDYVMVIAADQEILNYHTVGDYLITYTIERDGQILNPAPRLLDAAYSTPVILIDDLKPDEPLTLTGEINDLNFQVDYLIRLNPTDSPLAFELSTLSGDLIPLVGIRPAQGGRFTVAEGDPADTSVTLIYPPANAELVAGYYLLVVSRLDVEEGDTAGRYRLVIGRSAQDNEDEDDDETE